MGVEKITIELPVEQVERHVEHHRSKVTQSITAVDAQLEDALAGHRRAQEAASLQGLNAEPNGSAPEWWRVYRSGDSTVIADALTRPQALTFAAAPEAFEALEAFRTYLDGHAMVEGSAGHRACDLMKRALTKRKEGK